ncbi:hypothetical protein TASIC1_0003044800 [Trichoderma asperellum]|uniref:C3H1-type domain-containing protein n=1 Tax=Trichoderma asperellum TaxID=101201 RepID=A0A6V8QNM3_TRIAP|nr:hypothetical protein TASIC1_0003044800 [Trichoderma asperellum]
MDNLFKVENELRHESQRLLNAQIDLQNAANLRSDLERRVRLYEAQEEDAKDKADKEMDKLKNHNPYVMVLIDGDGLMFRDTWIKQGLEGGKKVAYALRAAVAERFGEEAEGLEIVAKVVANLSGLSKAMQRDGCVDSPGLLKDFTLGFTQAKATFDYIDVGYGKERADSKIKDGICEITIRISIIEGVATVPDLVATNVKIEKLGDGLFRDDKLSDKYPTLAQIASSQSPPAQLIASRTASPAISAGSSQTRTPTMSYAGIVSSASPPPQITLPFTLPRKQQTPSGTGSWREKSQARVQSETQYQLIPSSIPDNWNPGRRGFDEPIRVNIQVMETIKKRKDNDKLCNNHYLRGPCAKKDICPFAHDYKINEDEIKAVAVLARQNPCSSGQYCEAEDLP